NEPLTPGHPITLHSDGSFTIKFARILSAYPTITLRGGKGAHVILKSTRQVGMILSGNTDSFTAPSMDEVSTLTVEITNVTSPIEILDAGAIFTSQPVEYIGSFACSDEKLNRIWD